MSWADEMWFDGFEPPSFDELEDLWEKGQHRDQHGKEYKLSEMTDSHLINAMKYFAGWADIRPLVEEFKRRYKTKNK